MQEFFKIALRPISKLPDLSYIRLLMFRRMGALMMEHRLILNTIDLLAYSY